MLHYTCSTCSGWKSLLSLQSESLVTPLPFTNRLHADGSFIPYIATACFLWTSVTVKFIIPLSRFLFIQTVSGRQIFTYYRSFLIRFILAFAPLVHTLTFIMLCLTIIICRQVLPLMWSISICWYGNISCVAFWCSKFTVWHFWCWLFRVITTIIISFRLFSVISLLNFSRRSSSSASLCLISSFCLSIILSIASCSRILSLISYVSIPWYCWMSITLLQNGFRSWPKAPICFPTLCMITQIPFATALTRPTPG